jgi:hypothetical protein
MVLRRMVVHAARVEGRPLRELGADAGPLTITGHLAPLGGASPSGFRAISDTAHGHGAWTVMTADIDDRGPCARRAPARTVEPGPMAWIFGTG